MSELLFQSLYSGLLAGSVYALLALGLALVFGIMRLVNLAHGELVLLAGYIAYTFESSTGFGPLWSIPLAFIVVCATAIGIYMLLSRIKIDRELNSLLLTYGIAVILTNLILLIWNANIRSSSSVWLQEPIVIGDLYAMNGELVAFVMSLILLVALWKWLASSWYGRAVRAVSSHREASMLMGINPKQTEMISFLLAGMMASVAGVAIYCTRVLQPALGESLTIKAFIITVLAGIGSIPGVLIGAIVIGIAEAMSATLFNPAWQDLVSMGLFLLVLFLRPNGLFGAARRQG
ncbi:branched-chain amino acid ABC transporter [Chania multitudinisentens RB-25]|uniref:Branched-chain amino acid ABC transporter n=1 Tax=Chania multitudinisentens RB-25 TaxID=1441930 RepID=W0LGT7_9GAMM|nr:branched-chain amino acid ABC transporter permease [Chania multitudinisentens]AHG21175.1 branched-chain amino acid ABC transporter [Chania multitudinisentens RB-25]